MKALIASRDARARHWVRMALDRGWEILEVEDGLGARTLVQREQPDLLVCDETMEGYGGFGLAREVKAGVAAPAVIVLLERAQDDWLAKWANADRWFVRPVDSFELADAIRELMESRSLGATVAEGGTA